MNTQELKSAWTNFTVSVRGLEKQSHELLCVTVDHMFSHRMDTSVLRFALESLENVEGSFRLQALIAYVVEFTGVTVQPDTDRGFGFIVKKDKEREMTRGKRQLALIQSTPWFEWAEAEKPLNTPKLNESAITTAAKGYATGEISAQELLDFANTFVNKVKEHVHSDKKVQDFAVKYLEQQLSA